MRQIIQIMHTSLDGFVAGTNGELDWFENANEHLGFVNELVQHSDTIMLGRVTYEMYNSYWPDIETDQHASTDEKNYSRWYNNATKIILSRNFDKEIPDRTILISNDSINSVKELRTQKGKNILLFGSPTVGQLLAQENLIDEYWVFINPVVFGTGIPMFDRTNTLTRLNLIETKIITNGEVALHYVVRK
jgi:dihydrofolate reductase